MFERLSSQPAGRRRCLCHTPSHSVTLHHPLVTHSPFPWLLSPVVWLSTFFLKILKLWSPYLKSKAWNTHYEDFLSKEEVGFVPCLNTKSIIQANSHLEKAQEMHIDRLLVARLIKKRTKESWTENGCLCVFFVIWITEYASRGIRRSAWYFFRDLGGFPLLSSCNRMRKVIICLM